MIANYSLNLFGIQRPLVAQSKLGGKGPIPLATGLPQPSVGPGEPGDLQPPPAGSSSIQSVAAGGPSAASSSAGAGPSADAGPSAGAGSSADAGSQPAPAGTGGPSAVQRRREREYLIDVMPVPGQKKGSEVFQVGGGGWPDPNNGTNVPAIAKTLPIPVNATRFNEEVAKGVASNRTLAAGTDCNGVAWMIMRAGNVTGKTGTEPRPPFKLPPQGK